MKDTARKEDTAQRRAVVMGATSGLGMHVALALARQGWQVAIAGRREERLRQVAERHSGIVCWSVIDITAHDAPGRLYRLVERLGGMSLYVHSSGVGWQNDTLQPEKELLTVETNATGFVRMVGAAFTWMAQRQQPARIACITSIAGTRGLGAAPAYSATKRLQSHYLECLDQQARMRHLPIAVTDIRPGFVSTDLIAGCNYPLQMRPERVVRLIVRAVVCGRSVAVIDWRYRLLVAVWRLVPRWLWVRLRIA